MITFHPPRTADKSWAAPYLAQADYRGCEYSFANLFCWSRAYCQEIAQADGFLLIRVCGRMGRSYLYPAGRGDAAAAIRILEEDAAAHGEIGRAHV